MKVPYEYERYRFITDDTNALDKETLFLKTAQNSRYFDKLQKKPAYITPKELIAIWQLDQLRVIGVTGTNGKTTTAAAIYSLLLDLGHTPALQGTRGLFVGDKRAEEKSLTTPSILQTLYNMKRAKEVGCDFFAMEVSSHAIDQERIEGIDFALKLFTNVTQDHLDYHGTIEEYRRVKSLFFQDESVKLLNKDEADKITYNPANAYTYALDESATYKVNAFSLKGGITAYIKHIKEEATFASPMQGLFNLYNLLAAIAAVHLLTGRSLQEICDMAEHFGGVAGRMEVVSSDPLVIVDFAHTPDGMQKVFEAMKDHEMVVVFGAGGDRDKQKRPMMGKIAGRYAKRIFVTSDNPRSEQPEAILEDILQGLIGHEEKVVATPDRAHAIKMALDSLQEGEVLLILGKGDETCQEIKGEKIPFDDRKVVKKLLAVQEG